MWRFLDPPRKAKIAHFSGFWEKIRGLRRSGDRRGQKRARLENFGSGQGRLGTGDMLVETNKKSWKSE